MLEPANYVYIVGQCLLNPAWTKTGSDWSYPNWDQDVGDCYCRSGKYFDPAVQWCTGKFQCPDGETASVENGKWQCNVSSKEAGASDCHSPDTSKGNPIKITTGNKYQTETDYVGGGIFPLRLSRTYNSISGTWQFFSEIRPAVDLKIALVVRPDGKKYRFVADNAGGWRSDPDVTGHLQSSKDATGVITGWRYRTLDDMTETYDAAGKLLRVTNRSGLSHSYRHGDAEMTISDDFGHAIVIGKDALGRISYFTGPKQNHYHYHYDDQGRLTGLSYPENGGTRIYHYENPDFPRALTGISDANGQRYVTWGYDSSGRAISSEHSGGTGKILIDYSYLHDAGDPRVTVSNSLGKQTTYHLVTLHGVRKVTLVEGHRSPNCTASNKSYSYDANGFVSSQTDWNGSRTTFIRDGLGREISRTEAAGTSEERIITSEWHPQFNLPVKISAPGRQTTLGYDEKGNLLTRVKTDTT